MQVEFWFVNNLFSGALLKQVSEKACLFNHKKIGISSITYVRPNILFLLVFYTYNKLNLTHDKLLAIATRVYS